MKSVLKTVAGVAAFGLSSVALAGGSGYVAPAPMDDSGWYIGGSAGFGLTFWDNIDSATLRVGKENGFAGRAFLGYMFSRAFAAEFGWTYLPSRVKVNSTGSIRNWAFDLTGKMFVPVMDQWGVFARLGINYLKSSVRDSLRTIWAANTVFSNTISNFNVTYGAGLYWDYTAQLRLLAEWQRFHGKAKFTNRKYQPFMDAFTVGVSWKLPMDMLA